MTADQITHLAQTNPVRTLTSRLGELNELWLTSQSVNGDQAPAVRALHTDYLQEIS